MIKINTISNNKDWNKYIKNPKNFIERKILKLNKKFKKYKNNKIFLTILLSCNQEIKKLNKKFNKLWIHGLVHLLGYDHKKNKDFYDMMKVEKKFLSYLN